MAERSLGLLDGLLSEFPFVGEASKSVALSAILSAVARSMFDVVPAHGARAPAPGTGKSYLFDIVSSITAGEPCPVISATDEHDGETDKRIIGAALSGQLIINIDNVNGALGSPTLCQLITQRICHLRPLGQTPQVRVDNRSIVFFNGNNCHVRSDMTRRVLLAELDARVERPAERKFKTDPVAQVMANRGKYIAACMTILRAYIKAGRPTQGLTPMNSFGDWSDNVRSALVWLGKEDPCKTIEKVRDEDPELRKIAAFISAVQPHANKPEKPISGARLAQLAEEVDFKDGARVSVNTELNEFMQEFSGRGDKPNLQKLGRWLGQSRGRVIDGMRIASVYNSTRKASDWYIETVPVAGAK
jgi:putative DNA primase/helicase